MITRAQMPRQLRDRGGIMTIKTVRQKYGLGDFVRKLIPNEIAKVAEVAATSKKVLTPGETLDGEGGYTVYGTLLEAAEASDKQLVPIGLCRGAKVKTHIGLDSMITAADVDLPSSEFIDKLIAR